MKELSVEEKAKRYDSMFERLKEMYNNNKTNVADRLIYERYFPELKESENKRMIQYFKDLAPFDKADELYEKYGFSHKDAIAWLEKQGEHAKFRDSIQVGDKVTRNQDGVLVNQSQLKRVAKKDEKQGEQKQELLTKEKALKNSPFVEQKPVWSEEDELMLISTTQSLKLTNGAAQMKIDWLNSLKERVQPQNIVYYNPYKEVVESIAEMCKHYDKASHSGLRDFYDDVKVKCKDAKEYESLYPQSTWKPSDEQMEILQYICGTSSHPNEKVIPTLESLYQDLKKLREE